MKKNKLSLFGLTLMLCATFLNTFAAQPGDTITVQNKKFKLLSSNLISNPGFENGFTGWTDATTSAAVLTSAKFSISNTGGVSNSKYLIGLANENSGSAGSIGTAWPISSGKSYLFAYQVKYLSATAPAANEIYLKTSLTNNKTSPSEPKVIINESRVQGGGLWTQNYAYFTNAGKISVSFECPANCDKLWFVVSGAPSVHWRHAWDDNDANDEQWPYQVSFVNTNLLGYANVINGNDDQQFIEWNVQVQQRNLSVTHLSEFATVKVVDVFGRMIVEEKAENKEFKTMLTPGVYIVVVESASGIQTQKIIVR